MRTAVTPAGLGLLDFAIGFVLAALACAIELPILRRLQFRQHAYEDAPQTHQKKTGTPTMGGLAFVIALLPLLATFGNPFTIALLLLVLACAAVGFVDDYLAIRRGKNAGLRARTKYLITALIAAVFLWQVSALNPSTDVLLRIPGFTLICPHWLWFVLGIFAVSGTIHAVNLTDGLDGLATGTMIPPLFVFYAISAVFPLTFLPSMAQIASVAAVQTASALGIGACFAFLLYNRYPAKMIMGDTGSLALGALLSGLAILSWSNAAADPHRRRFCCRGTLGHHTGDLFQTYGRKADLPYESAASSFRAPGLAGNQGNGTLLAGLGRTFRFGASDRSMSLLYTSGQTHV